jgi:hypothetical protein
MGVLPPPQKEGRQNAPRDNSTAQSMRRKLAGASLARERPMLRHVTQSHGRAA